jgi:hypothetical protein
VISQKKITLQVLEQQILDTTKPTTPDILPEFKKRGITTVTGGSPHTEGPIDRIVYQPTDLPKRTYDPRTDPNALLKRPGGVGTLLKNVALGIVAPQLLAGSKLAPLYQGYRTYQAAKKYLPEGVRETIQTAFKPRLTTETKRKTKPLVARDNEGPKVRTVAEKVATGQGLESGEKLLGLDDAQQNYIRKIIAGKDRRELMMIAGKAKISIDSGKASQIEKDVFQMIQEYLV